MWNFRGCITAACNCAECWLTNDWRIVHKCRDATMFVRASSRQGFLRSKHNRSDIHASRNNCTVIIDTLAGLVRTRAYHDTFLTLHGRGVSHCKPTACKHVETLHPQRSAQSRAACHRTGPARYGGRRICAQMNEALANGDQIRPINVRNAN